MDDDNFIQILALGFVRSPHDAETFYPAAKTFSTLENVTFDAETLAGLLVSVTECMVDVVPEKDQIQFEKKALRLFNKKVKEREEIMERIDLESEDEDGGGYEY
ncbi:MAG: hypothetical protein EBU90_00235 [Proteobacteria bacterium]|nr:hypothetical protein [Pseudomonadota bacterium]NBP12860.1 hypothetical protein [bacterium]